MTRGRIFIGLTIVAVTALIGWQIFRRPAGKPGLANTASVAQASEKPKPVSTDSSPASKAEAKTTANQPGSATGSVSNPTPSATSSNTLPRLTELGKGSKVAIPLPGGGVATGEIQLVQTDVGGIIRVGGVLTGSHTGSFSLAGSADVTSGRILMPQEKTAYLITGTGAGAFTIKAMSLNNVVCYPFPTEPSKAAPLAAGASGPQAAPPILSSRPSATAVLYLDFNGETVTDPDWPAYAPDGVTITGSTIVAPAPSLTSAQITEIWSRVKEDYWPFNIDITTDPNRYNNTPLGQRMRVIVTPNDAAAPGSGGVAYVGSFTLAGSPYYYFQSDNPAWVFNTTVDGIAEAISHELGHTLGLRHDGRSPALAGFSSADGEYYYGHGDPNSAVGWAPIMGAGYYQKLVQWSKGEYPGANNHEDDVAIISGQASFNFGDPTSYTNNLSYVADEAGDTHGTAVNVDVSSGTASLTGIISAASDADYYKFVLNAASTVNLTVAPPNAYPKQADLDVQLELQDANGVVLASSNPDGALDASLNLSLGAGTYYIKIAGAGRAGNGTDYGYSNYGSIGSYAASLQVIVLGPAITVLSQTRQVLMPGQGMSLSVSATGTGALTYQWVHNGLPIAGATTPVFSITGLTQKDAGWYMVLVTDSNGTQRSAPIFVIVAPSLTQVRAWGTNTNGVQTIPAGLTDATAISAGGTFALALKRDGTVVSWGASDQGQGAVPSGLTNAVAVSAGYGHALALKSDSTVVGWGGNYFSALTAIPAGLSGVVAIKAANAHSLALKSDGTVVGWGQNISGEAASPVGLTGVVAISAGFEFSVALKSDGTVVSWGDASFGKTSVPAGLTGVVAIAAGDAGHTLALKSDGTVVAWGRSNEGQTSVPAGLNHVVMIAAGERHSVALKDDGTVVMWGNLTAVPSDLSGVLAVSGGTGFSLGLSDGTLNAPPTITTQPVDTVGVETSSASISVTAVGGAPLSYQWRKGGSNIPGATSATLTLTDLAISDAGNYDVVVSNYLGSVTSTSAGLTVKAIPVVTSLSSGRQVVQPGQSLNLSVTATGTGTLSYQWTHNGQLIAGATSSSLNLSNATAQTSGWYLVFITDANGTRRSLPIRVLLAPAATQVRAWGVNDYGVTVVPGGLNGVLSIAAGRGQGLAIVQNKTVVAWGNNSTGQANLPAGLSGVEAISGGNGYCIAVKSDTTVVGWGSNNYGAQLVPAGLNGVVDISAGDSHAVALKSNGRVVAWGSNNYNQTNIPSGLRNVFAISAGGFHTLAVKDDGTVMAWGDNSSGQLQIPVGLNNVVAVAGGYTHSLALKSDGTVVAWGSNSYGETTVPAGLTGVISIAAARYHSLALKADGTVVAWGASLGVTAAALSDLTGVYAIADADSFSLALRDATGESAPVITTQPAGLSLAQGERAIFTVVANGAGTFAYQWRKNGVTISGATSATFIIPEVVSGDAGNYDVVVSNYIGSTTSAVAALSVNPAAVITNLSPTRQVLSPGQSMNLSVTATGVGALSYQWTRNGRPIPGARGSAYTVPSVGFADAGWYLVYITDSNGTKRSTPIFVTIAPLITEIRAWGSNGYGEQGVPAGLSDAVAIAAGDVTALALKRDGTVVAWGTDWSHGGNTTIPTGLNNVVAIAAGPFQSLALKNDGTVVSWGWYNSGTHPPPAGLNNVVAIAANELHSYALKSDGTVVIWGDSNNGVPAGLIDVIGIAAPGHDSALATRNDGTVAYWNANLSGQNSVPANFSDATAISAGLNHALALKSDGTVVGWSMTQYGSSAATVPAGLAGVTAVGAGGYHSLALKNDGTVVAWGTNDSGQATVPANLSGVFAVSAGGAFSLALRDPTTLAITAQPQNQTANIGTNVTFSVVAGGTAPFTYQWRKDGSNLADGSGISGTTTNTLTLTGVTPANVGSYDVVVGNTAGSVTSNAASLVVYSLPVVALSSATRQVAVAGNDLTLSATATGSGSLSYQWTHNGISVPGATSNTLLLAHATPRDSGYYLLYATNPAGTTQSAPIFVIVAPAVTQVVAWGVNTQGQAMPPSGLNDAVAVDGGNRHSLALRANGTITGWGYGSDFTPLPGAPANVVAIAADSHNAALRADGTVVTFGTGAAPAPASLTNVVSVAAGYGRLYALKSDGTVVAWNAIGGTTIALPGTFQNLVGISAGLYYVTGLKADGTVVGYDTSTSTLPSDGSIVPAGLSGVVAISSSSTHTLALKNDGTVVAWGDNTYGQLNVPSSLGPVIAVEAGPAYSMALQADGTVVAWGSIAPVPSGLSNVFAISAGGQHSLALRDGTSDVTPAITTQPQGMAVNLGDYVRFVVVANGNPPLSYQWRRNGVDIPGATLSDYSFIASQTALAGDYTVVVSSGAATVVSDVATLVVRTAPTVMTQPLNQFVNTGDAAILSFGVAGTAPLAYQWQRQVVSSFGSSWSNVTDGGVFSGATSGVLVIYSVDSTMAGEQYRCVATNAAGSVTSATARIFVISPAGGVKVGGGGAQSLFLRTDGSVWGTGWLGFDPAGGSDTPLRNTPIQMLSGVVAMSAANHTVTIGHKLFIKADGTLWAMGNNASGQLCDGTTTTRTKPIQVASGVVAAAAEQDRSYFIKSDGTLWGAGSNDGGAFGTGTLASLPVPAQLAIDVKAVAPGYRHLLMLKTDGSLWVTGNGSYGQLGLGGVQTALVGFAQLATGVTSIAASERNSFFVKSDGTLWGTGANNYGQLGDGTTTQRLTPVQVAVGVAKVFSGLNRSYFIKTDGTLWGMGENTTGYLGDGTTTSRLSPVQITSNVVSVAVGVDHAIFAKADGTIWSVGGNYSGQLGDGTNTNRLVPVWIAGGSLQAPAVPAGLAASDASTYTGVHVSWGAVLGAQYYQVYRYTADDSASATLLADQVEAAYYQDVTAVAGTTYYYWVKAVNGAGNSGFSGSDSGMRAVAVLPVITSHPANRIYNQYAPAPAIFTVTATGTPPLIYQWRRNGLNLGESFYSHGVATATLSLTDQSTTDAGTITVVVSNGAGSVESNPATFSVGYPPTIYQHPQSLTVSAGAPASFTVVPITDDSIPMPDYAWRLNGNLIPGATSQTLTIATAQPADAGSYTVQVSNMFGAVVSTPAVLTVTSVFDTWQQSKFTANELLDASISGPNADPDHDGLPNLLEYALGLEPKTADTVGLPNVSVVGSDWTYTYTRPSDRTDISYTVEYSTDLINWSSSGVVHTQVSTDGTTDTWRATYPTASAPNCFFRLKVTQ